MTQEACNCKGNLCVCKRTLRFDGPDLTEKDVRRLTGQVQRVYDVMIDGEWRTLADIHSQIARNNRGIWDSEASISARLRQLRGMSYVIERRRVRTDGALYQYRMDTSAIGGKR